jgi:hypothetical protein
LVPAPRTSFPGTHPPNSRVSVLPEEARRAHQLNRRPGYRSPGLLLSPRRFSPRVGGRVQPGRKVLGSPLSLGHAKRIQHYTLWSGKLVSWGMREGSGKRVELCSVLSPAEVRGGMLILRGNPPPRKAAGFVLFVGLGLYPLASPLALIQPSS